MANQVLAVTIDRVENGYVLTAEFAKDEYATRTYVAEDSYDIRNLFEQWEVEAKVTANKQQEAATNG